MRQKLFAIMHDGTLSGDSKFNVSDKFIFPYNGETWRELKKKIVSAICKKWGIPEDESRWNEEMDDYSDGCTWLDYIEMSNVPSISNIRGAWILTKKDLKKVNFIGRCAYGGGDSVGYATNRAMKAAAKMFAIKELGYRIKLRDYI